MESNDSPEIPDRGETSDIPGLPSGELLRTLIKSGHRKQVGIGFTSWVRGSNRNIGRRSKKLVVLKPRKSDKLPTFSYVKTQVGIRVGERM